MTKPGRNEGCRVLDDFVCEAIADPKQPRASPTNQGRNEGMRVLRDIIVAAGADPAAEPDAGKGLRCTARLQHQSGIRVLCHVGALPSRPRREPHPGEQEGGRYRCRAQPGDTITIDVKAVAGRVGWLVGKQDGSPREHHFVVLLAYDDKFKEIAELPKAWVLPHEEFLGLVQQAKAPSKVWYVRRGQVSKLENRQDAWDLLRTTPGI